MYNKLDIFRNEVSSFLAQKLDKIDKWIRIADKKMHKNVVGEHRKECICYLLYFRLPNDLGFEMLKVAEFRKQPICDFMVDICKYLGIYNKIV